MQQSQRCTNQAKKGGCVHNKARREHKSQTYSAAIDVQIEFGKEELQSDEAISQQ